MLNVTLIGTGGTMPLKNRWLSSALITSNGHSVLLDCGEGTQIAMKMTGHKFKTIDVICITHFHADHLSGLPGFLLTMSNEGRSEPVVIVGPKGVARYVGALCIIAPNLTFPLLFTEFSPEAIIRCGDMIVNAFLLRHSVPCIGYSVKLPRVGKFDPEKAKRNNVPLPVWKQLQKNEKVEYNGTVYTSDMVLGGARRGSKITFCTDTRPVRNIVENAYDSDLLICEGMFGEQDKLIRAKESGHMLFSEAASLAAEAKVRRLWLTHYSPSLTDPQEFLQYAKEIFPETECGFDGKSLDIMFDEE